jgi:hypothetical protein
MIENPRLNSTSGLVSGNPVDNPKRKVLAEYSEDGEEIYLFS